MNTAENNDNCFQNITIFVTYLTLGSFPNGREKFDTSLKKKKKKAIEKKRNKEKN